MSIEWMMPSNHLILRHPLLLPSIFPSINCYYFFFPQDIDFEPIWDPYWSFPWLSLSNVGKRQSWFLLSHLGILCSGYETKGSELSNTKAPVMWSISGNSIEFSAPDPVKRTAVNLNCSMWFRQVECGPKRTTVPLGCVRESGTRRSVRFCLVGWPSNPTVIPGLSLSIVVTAEWLLLHGTHSVTFMGQMSLGFNHMLVQTKPVASKVWHDTVLSTNSAFLAGEG